MGLLRKIFGNGEGKSEGTDEAASGSGIRECIELHVVSSTHSEPDELLTHAGGGRPTSTPSTAPMSSDADHDVSDVDDTTLSEASEEFDISEEELDAWEDVITSDAVASADRSPVVGQGPTVRGPEGGRQEGARKEVSAALHVLADYSVRVSIGPVSDAWVPELQRAATGLLSAQSLSQGPTSSALLSRLVWLVDGGSRQELFELVSALPAGVLGWPEWASDLGGEARRRERRILHELFLARDGLDAEQRQRLEREMTLDQLRVAAPEALAAAFQAPLERALELCQVVRAYCAEREARPPDTGGSTAARAGELSGFPVGSSTFWAALEQLEQHCQKFADCDEDDSTELRALRQRRRDALTRVNLLLAEDGEIELLDMLVPCALTERIRRLRSWFGVDAEGQD